MRKVTCITRILLAAILLLAVLSPAAQALTRDQRRQIMKSSVLILAMDVRNGEVANVAWSGSGTIIDPKGLILTNAHVVEESTEWNMLGILVTTQSDQKPEPAYIAEVVVSDTQVDLAVIKVVSDFRGEAVDPATLNLASVPLGDAESLELGDELSIYGYPGIGAGTITLTEGKVAGFVQEEGVDYQRAWIKTDATISGGNSGGTAVDADGNLVAIPTRSSDVDVRAIADTNGDGVIDENDSAVPVGGFINLLRPINLAFPLIVRARGATVTPDGNDPLRPTPVATDADASGAAFSDFTFCSELDTQGSPADPATRFPDTVTRILAFSDFVGMRDGVNWNQTWTLDGETVLDKAYSWDEGEEGTLSVGLLNGGDPMPAGAYELTVSVSGEPVQSGSVFVEASSSSQTPTQRSRGVTLSGYLLDAYTGEPVEGGTVIVLQPEATVAQYLEQGGEALVAAYGTSDADGYYTTTPPLERGYSYGVIVVADGYRTLAEDSALPITDEDADDVEMTDIELVWDY